MTFPFYPGFSDSRFYIYGNDKMPWAGGASESIGVGQNPNIIGAGGRPYGASEHDHSVARGVIPGSVTSPRCWRRAYGMHLVPVEACTSKRVG